ncbi:glycosyltransferase family 2 protein [Dolichospermum flos-aquae]|jgi:glycosyltransferase involved in cell wall biosynthesis|uniref:Glycosyltransferase family 2 protein n=1 Tax=Dolichospermum flos-aquae CCAP 1403/13F TaxID=315271 RepID=A0A6H2C571_DOLFA|nr:glycosyltransferase family 2 protein [Dolichospermum flos-aquae]QJB46985.1 glycosyltransferase family 2 protein [Dolichospermum flos-aquae CCAP 1403/13F]
MPKISVIIPNYNHAQFLEQRIESVLNQTVQDVEVIFLDDNSTDNSREVFSKYVNHPKISHVIFNETNSGSPFKQWNKGFSLATGEYIWLAESDDYADPRFLETLVEILEENPQVGVAYCQSHQVDKYNDFVATLHCWTDELDKERWHNDFINNGLEECRKYLIVKNTIPNASAVLTRRYLFKEIGYADESMFLCGDWLTWIKLLLRCDIAYSAQVLNFWRTHSTNVRSKSSLNGLGIYERMKILSIIQKQIDIPKKVAEQIKNDLVYEWVSLMLRRKNRVSLKKSIEFYQLSKICDSAIEMRYLKQAGLYISEKLRRLRRSSRKND